MKTPRLADPSSSSDPPVFVMFENGSELKPGLLNAKLIKNEKHATLFGKTVEFKLQVPETKQEFVGNPANIPGKRWSYVVRNKTTGKITVKYCPRDLHVVQLRHKPKEDENLVQVLRKPDILDSLKGIDRLKLLAKREGRKDLKKRAAEQEIIHAGEGRNVLNVSREVAAELDAAEAAKPAEKIKSSAILPDFDPEAKKPLDIYKLDQFLTSEELDEMQHLAKDLLETPPQALREKGYYRITIGAVQSILKSSPIETTSSSSNSSKPQQKDAPLSAEQLKQGAYAVYMEHLLKFVKHLNRFGIVKNEKFYALPGVVQARVQESFLTQQHDGKQEWTMSSTEKDKLHLQVLTIGLVLNRLQLSLTRILEDFKPMPFKKLQQLCGWLGCMISRDRALGQLVATLKHPPREKMDRPKKRKATGSFV